MLKKLFLDHPRSVNESYFEHFCHAAQFSLKMLTASLACFIHALVPCLCERTGSRLIIRLHDTMVTNRVKLSHQGTDEQKPGKRTA